MKAVKPTVQDGQHYEIGEEIPDLGSLVGSPIEGDANKRSYEGHYSDRNKLPKYDDLKTGSSAFLSNNGKFVLYKYYEDTKTWEGNGEVI